MTARKTAHVTEVSAPRSTRIITCANHKPTVSPLLTPPTSHNILLLQSLLNSIPYRQDNVRRRKDEHRVGTAARGISERLYRVPRCVPSDGRPAGRVRRALSA